MTCSTIFVKLATSHEPKPHDYQYAKKALPSQECLFDIIG